MSVPFELLANAPYVKASVNGKGPYDLVVDTGSINSPIAIEMASRLGIAVKHDPNRTVRMQLADGLAVTTESSPLMSFANLWALPGRKIYGIIGYDVLRHFVVEFDYEHRTITFYDPEKFKYAGAGTAFPAAFEMDYDPQIEGQFIVGGTPTAARFTLDTGAGGTVISAPLVKRGDLVTRVTRKVPNPKPRADGVNGMVFDTITGRIDGVRLGSYTVEQPLVALSRDTDGTFAMEDIGVNLGGNILQRFKVTIDYPNARVYLEPNNHFGDAFPADASGLVLGAEGARFKRILVQAVLAGSPADEAGIKPGDAITAIDGHSTDGYALWQIQELFKASGQTRQLTILRGGRSRTLSLKLRALA